MNKLIFILFALTLMGCEDNRTPRQVQQDLDNRYGIYIKTVNYRGHSYILYSGFRTGGNIIHDPD